MYSETTQIRKHVEGNAARRDAFADFSLLQKETAEAAQDRVQPTTSPQKLGMIRRIPSQSFSSNGATMPKRIPAAKPAGGNRIAASHHLDPVGEVLAASFTVVFSKPSLSPCVHESPRPKFYQ